MSDRAGIDLVKANFKNKGLLSLFGDMSDEEAADVLDRAGRSIAATGQQQRALDVLLCRACDLKQKERHLILPEGTPSALEDLIYHISYAIDETNESRQVCQRCARDRA